MDIVAITLFMYLVTALALGAVSNYLRSIWMWLASTMVITGAYMFGFFRRRRLSSSSSTPSHAVSVDSPAS